MTAGGTPLPRYRASRVALLADVHGNAPALAAVLAELEREPVDLVVVAGDVSWGSLVDETVALAQGLGPRAAFVRGNAERALLELEAGTRGGEQGPTERERWMLERHDGAALGFLRSFHEQALVEVEGLGLVRVCHGSPRSDTECVTDATPEERVREFMEGVAEGVVATAHVHVQFDRRVAGVRSLSPGSVGLPYEGRPGAYWALLGPDVQLRRTAYDVAETTAAYLATDDPARELMVELLERPPARAEAVEHAERVVFTD